MAYTVENFKTKKAMLAALGPRTIETGFFWAVEVTDPLDNGKIIKYPFVSRAHAVGWARDEVRASEELGIHGVKTRIYRTRFDGDQKT